LLKIRFSMRFTLGATIVLMGVLGLALALTTGEIYQKQTLENQRTALEELVQISVGEQLHDLEDRARDLGLALQSEADFRRALSSGKHDVLVQQLQNQFRQYFVTANIIKLERLVVYDIDYHLLGTATAGAVAASSDASGCPTLIEHARLRSGAERLQSLAALCQNDHQARYAVLVPAGGLKPIGYIEVVTDPVPTLAHIETKLGFPVRIRDARDVVVYRSDTWPPPNAMQNVLVAEHVLSAASGEPLFKIAVMRNVAQLQQGLARTRWLVLTLAIASTLIGVILAFFVLEKTTLQPLNDLARQLRRVGSNMDHLGEQVEPSGIAEIRELGEDFNQMARELDQLYGSLEHMAFTDPLTNLPNRARFRDSLEESVRQYTLAHQPFALFLMDLDRFKAVNDSLGHQIGDLLLQEVSTRLRSVLRESDTVARLDNESIVGLEGKMVARLGGDEFAAILPRVSSIDDASAVARKLLLTMQDPFLIRGHAISIGISIGIALYPQHGADIDTLMQRADAAMYFAKNNQCGLAFPDTMQQVELI
jgi:diguanylate cyclase